MRTVTHIPVLTRREIEVLRLIAQGKTNQEIADSLIIERSTVINHVRCMMVKLSVFRRVQLTTYALKAKLISLDEIDLPEISEGLLQRFGS